jgi:hypothetical protein
MASPFDPLVDIIHSTTTDSWKERSSQALAALFGTRYRKDAEKSVTLRAPEMTGGDGSNVPYAAYIHPSNATSGGYGGMSFVIFPANVYTKYLTLPSISFSVVPAGLFHSHTPTQDCVLG